MICISIAHHSWRRYCVQRTFEWVAKAEGFVFGACLQLVPSDTHSAQITQTWINHHNKILSVQAIRHLPIRQDHQRYGREANAARSRLLAKSAGD